MKKNEKFALNHYLNQHPLKCSFEKIITKLKNDGFTPDGLWPNDAYQGIPSEDLATLINDMALHLERFFK